jgi:hypothetical protein
MTSEHQASRTLVKSPPELWAECSDASSLARHIGEFGEIRITRLEPETSVAWEGEHASGTVTIEPSGWGTRVTLTARTVAAVLEEEAEPEPVLDEAEPEAVEPEPVHIEPPVTEVEEETDAKVEETTTEPDPAVAAVAAPAGGRWKRLIARTREWFQPSIESAPVVEEVPQVVVERVDPEPEPVDPEPEPVDPEPEAVEPEPVLIDSAPEVVEPKPELAEPEPHDSLDAELILNGALDSLGQAHHRPFSRA